MLLLSVAGMIFTYYYEKSLRASACGILEYMSTTIEGDNYFSKNSDYKWPGLVTIQTIFSQIIKNINNLDTDKNNIFINYSSIISQDSAIIQAFSDYSVTPGKKNVTTPYPNRVDNITLLYNSIYGPSTEKDTILYNIYKEYNNSLNNYSILYKEMKDSFDNFYSHKSDIKTVLTNASSDLDALVFAYDNLTYVVGNNYNRMVKIIEEKMIFSSRIIYCINMSFILLCIFFSVMYNCIATTKFSVFKIMIHISWNVFIAISALGLLESSFYGIMMILARKTCSTFNYLLSDNFMLSQEGIDLYGNLTESQIEYFHACISYETSNLADTMSIKNEYFDYIDIFYKNYKLLKDYEQRIPIYENNTSLFEEQIDKLTDYLEDFSLTTTFAEYNQDDVNYNINELNLWTDVNMDGSYQRNCSTGTQDRWVSNVNNCPENYIYTKDGVNTKNCLLISDWNSTKINYRYSTACLSIYSGGVLDGILPYFLRIDMFRENNILLINEMIDSINDLEDKYFNLLNDIEDEIESNEDVFKSFNDPFSLYNDNTTIYNMFSCKIVKNELTGFYDKFYFSFHKFSCVEMGIFLGVAVINYICNYFLIKSIYSATNNALERKQKKKNEESDSSSGSSSDESDESSEKQKNQENKKETNEENADENDINDENISENVSDVNNDPILTLNGPKKKSKMVFDENDYVSENDNNNTENNGNIPQNTNTHS